MIDPAYEGEVHIAPDTFEGCAFPLGVHDFSLQCFCHPEVKQVYGCTLIVDSMRRTLHLNSIVMRGFRNCQTIMGRNLYATTDLQTSLRENHL